MAGLFEYVLFGDDTLSPRIPPVPGHLFEYYLVLFRDRNAIGALPNFGNGTINKGKIKSNLGIVNNANSPNIETSMNTLLDRVDDLVTNPLMTVEHVIGAMRMHKHWKENQASVAAGATDEEGNLIVALPFEFRAADMKAVMGWDVD